jgi:tRNA(Ile)-lysidine synthase
MDLPLGVRVLRRGHLVVFTRRDASAAVASSFEHRVDVPGEIALPHGGTLTFAVRDRDAWPGGEAVDRWSAYFDADDLVHPLVAREIRPGDRMRLFGLRGSRKVSDLLSEAHVPRHARARQIVLVAAAEIVWVPGIRRSEIAPVLNSTRHVVEARLQWSTHPWT